MTYILGEGASDSLFSDVTILAPLDTSRQYTNISSLGDLTDNGTTDIDELDDKNLTGSSLSAAGATSVIEIPYPANQGTGDWTFDFWFMNKETTGNQPILSNYTGASANSMIIDRRNATGVRLFLRDSSNSLVQATGSTDLVQDAWTWIAISRVGNTCYLLLDGTVSASVDVTGRSYDWTTKAQNFFLGKREDENDTEPEFRASEFRFTEAGRYDTGGGVPTSPLFGNATGNNKRRGFF